MSMPAAAKIHRTYFFNVFFLEDIYITTGNYNTHNAVISRTSVLNSNIISLVKNGLK
jgi:hypothetical protein